jgi:predicted amidohydrolase
MGNIEIHPSVKKELLQLLEKPLHLVAYLYRLLEPQFRTLVNPVFTQPLKKEKFNALCDFLFTNLLAMYRENPDEYTTALSEIIKTIWNERDLNLLCLSLFKAAADALAISRKGTLKTMEIKKIDGLIIAPKPANPIHEMLLNPIRKNYGTGFQDMTGIFDYITVIKKTNLEIKFIKNKILNRTCSYLKRKIKDGFRIAITPLMEDLVFELDSHLDKWPANEKTPYWFTKIQNAEDARKWLIEKVLNPCLQKKVDILILPELSIDKDLLDFLKNWLKQNNRERVSAGKQGLLLVIAGSFHFENQNHERFNSSTVLNHAGDILWTQNKIKRFSFDKTDIQKKPQLQTLLKTSPNGGYEGIYETDTICCADTPLGRISVCICIDFIHADHIDAFLQTQTNIFFVPAMSPHNTRFQETAKVFARDNLAAAFVANAAYAAQKTNSTIHQNGTSFYTLPNKKRTDVHAANDNKDLVIFDSKKLTKI